MLQSSGMDVIEGEVDGENVDSKPLGLKTDYSRYWPSQIYQL